MKKAEIKKSSGHGSDWFKKKLEKLISLDETGGLVFSFYLNLEGPGGVAEQIIQLASSMESGMNSDDLPKLFQALTRLKGEADAARVEDKYLGLAYFYRPGKEVFEEVFKLQVPVESWACIGTTPNIVPLVELKDSYDRYVVFISTEKQARIMEIVVGSVTRDAWLNRPKLRQKVGREWTREHYQNHRNDRNRKFIKEKIAVLKDLMNKSGHSHLILAGNPERISLIRNELPRELADKVIDSQKLVINEVQDEVVRGTINSFIASEIKESQAALDLLRRKLQSGDGATVGYSQVFKAMEAGVVDVLILSKYEASQKIPVPPEELIQFEDRDALVKKALIEDIPIEIVEEGSFLDGYDGIGALLRYKAARYIIGADSHDLDFKKAS